MSDKLREANELVEWVEKRLLNCCRIAEERRGLADRDGWLDYAEHFRRMAPPKRGLVKSANLDAEAKGQPVAMSPDYLKLTADEAIELEDMERRGVGFKRSSQERPAEAPAVTPKKCDECGAIESADQMEFDKDCRCGGTFKSQPTPDLPVSSQPSALSSGASKEQARAWVDTWFNAPPGEQIRMAQSLAAEFEQIRTAEKERCAKLESACRLALTRMAHTCKPEWYPTEQWAEKGSMNFEHCDCEISVVEAAIRQGKREQAGPAPDSTLSEGQ